MYGQLKSTVKCLECGNISITFDPFLTLSLPITKASYFKVPFVPYEVFRPKSDGAKEESSEEDPDYKDDSKMRITEHFEFSFSSSPTTTVLDIKQQIIQKASKIGESPISPENLELCMCKYGEVYEQFEDTTCVDTIDAGGGRLFMIETHKGKSASDEKVLELNYSKCSISKRGLVTSMMISGAVPRF